MASFELYDFYHQVKNNDILISFKGALSQDILVQMGEFIKNQLSVSKKLKKIFSVFVEMSQNIMHYSAEREIINDKEVGVGIILFIELDDGYEVYGGNAVNKSQADNVREKLDIINTLNKEDLKDLYHRQRKSPTEFGSKGAGLGLIDMARKSSGNIFYKITEMDDKLSFLELSVKFDNED